MAPAPDPRHARTVRLQGVGLAGQERIAAARVIVVGAGGLGSPVLQYLAASGVGRLGVVDPDAVAASDLARQIIHAGAELGAAKTASAVRAVRQVDPAIEVTEHPVELTAENARELLAGWDVVVDATDHPASRYLVSDAAAMLGIPEVWGAALGFEGQVSVFGSGLGGPVDYRDLHPVPVDDADSCSTVGVLGPVCGVIGSAMAVEVLKLITGVGIPLRGAVLHYDGAEGSWRRIPLRRRVDRTPVAAVGAGLAADPSAEVVEIAWAERGDRAIIDVRRPEERAAGHVPGDAPLPLDELLRDPGRVAGPVLVYCATGRRSARAVAALRGAGVDAVSLRGGFAALD